jgi:alkylhydroperoxidase family enzyme
MLTESGTLDDATWNALESEVGRNAALDLVVIVGYYSMVVRVLSALDIELEPDWAEHLRAHPLVPVGEEIG